MVGRAGGAMVRWGTAEGIGSFSTTVPEKACRGKKKREKKKEKKKEKTLMLTLMTNNLHLTETAKV